MKDLILYMMLIFLTVVLGVGCTQSQFDTTTPLVLSTQEAPPTDPPVFFDVTFPISITSPINFIGTYNNRNEFDDRIRNQGYSNSCIKIDGVHSSGPPAESCLQLSTAPLTCSGNPPLDENRSRACPQGQSGLVTESLSYHCEGTTWVASDWVEVSNTCTVPGSFSMAAPAFAANANTTPEVRVYRSGGASEFTLYYWFSGEGCQDIRQGAVSFAHAQTTAVIPTPLKNSGECTVYLAEPVAPAALGAYASTRISINSTPAPADECPPQPPEMLQLTLERMGQNHQQVQASGQVVAIDLPITGGDTGVLHLGETPATASPSEVVIEMSINKCPGHIDTDQSNPCNWYTTNAHFNSLRWYNRSASADPLAQYRCMADPNSKYYINVRWTYSACGLGVSTCGFHLSYGY